MRASVGEPGQIQRHSCEGCGFGPWFEPGADPNDDNVVAEDEAEAADGGVPGSTRQAAVGVQGGGGAQVLRGHGGNGGREDAGPPHRDGRVGDDFPKGDDGAGTRADSRHRGGDSGAPRCRPGVGAEASGAASDFPRHERLGRGAGGDAGQHREPGEQVG